MSSVPGKGRPTLAEASSSGSRWSVWVRTGDASVRPYTTERRAPSNRAVDCTKAGATGAPPVCTRRTPRGRQTGGSTDVGEEVAALVAFLLSGEAAAITGQEIAICGGASL